MIYLDMDGVLANFDKSAARQMNTDNIYKYEFVYGTEAFWFAINQDPDFWLTMELMPDAAVLLNAVWHKRPDLKVLTALPKKNTERTKSLKEAWIHTNIGDIEVVSCFTPDKRNYCQPGDVLVDDRNIQAEPWVAKGGVFILHHNADNTVKQMLELGVL